MKSLILTNYTSYPNLVILLRGLTLHPKKIAIIDDSHECLLSFLGSYLLQMQCEYRVYSKPVLQEELFVFKPEIIICLCDKSCISQILRTYYQEKNVIIVQILNSYYDNFQIKEYKIPLLEIEMYNFTSRQSNIVYLNNPEKCHSDIINLNQYATVRVQ